VHANPIPQTTGKKYNESVHTHSIFENFQSGTRTKGKNALEIPTFLTIPQVLTIPAYLWLNTNQLQNF